MARLREIGPVLADLLREMPYAESRTIHSDPDFPHSYYGDSALLSPVALGRTVNFVFGAGDRTEGLYEAGTRERLAELESRYDPGEPPAEGVSA